MVKVIDMGMTLITKCAGCENTVITKVERKYARKISYFCQDCLNKKSTNISTPLLPGYVSTEKTSANYNYCVVNKNNTYNNTTYVSKETQALEKLKDIISYLSLRKRYDKYTVKLKGN